MNWINRNKYHILLALIVGVLAFIIAHPAFANLPTVGAMPVFEPKTCKISVADLDMSKLLTIIRAVGSEAYDAFYVFAVTIDGVQETAVAVVKGKCVVDVQ